MAKLSETMRVALQNASAHGKLVRWRGGFWTYPNCTVKQISWPDGCKVPDWYVGTQTVNALIERGHLVGVPHSHFGALCEAIVPPHTTAPPDQV